MGAQNRQIDRQIDRQTHRQIDGTHIRYRQRQGYMHALVHLHLRLPQEGDTKIMIRQVGRWGHNQTNRRDMITQIDGEEASILGRNPT